jgi:hypothetical protein
MIILRQLLIHVIITGILNFGPIWFTNFSCKNSWVKNSGTLFDSPFIYSILKSKELKIACHMANICFNYLESIRRGKT